MQPHRSAIFENALAGVKAGKAEGFTLVVGIDRTGNIKELLRRGADVIIIEFPTENYE